MSRTFRRFALTGVLTVATAVCAPVLLAQRGSAPPPPASPPGNSGGPAGPGGPGSGIGVTGGIGIGIRTPYGPPNFPGGGMHRGSALGLPGRWWDDRHVIKQLSLRPNQQKQMDAIFEAHKAAMSSSLQNLQRERAQLGSLSQKDLQDENKVLAAIDRVVAARADLARQTTQVLSDLRKQLDPQQTAALDKQISSNRQ